MRVNLSPVSLRRCNGRVSGKASKCFGEFFANEDAAGHVANDFKEDVVDKNWSPICYMVS